MRDHLRIEWLCCRAGRKTNLVVRLMALAVACLVPACGTASSPRASSPRASSPASSPWLAPFHVSAAKMAQLPMATTFGTSLSAPRDQDPYAPETGIVLHPTATRVIYARPGGQPVAVLPTTELKSPTWVPVVQSKPGWDRVLLPTRPNRSTGWIYLGGGGLQSAFSAYRVQINLSAYRLTVFDNGRSLGSWPIAEGAQGTPTPTGRTFLLASMSPVRPTFSSLILPLGLHSDTLNAFGGGPGTVALHGWPDPAVFGRAISHGCVRVPAAALRVLSQVPLGSSVMIIS
jgi:hypothetical protein